MWCILLNIKITAIYLLAFFMMFLTSCSEIADTNARELRNASWVQKDNNNLSLSLSFENDDGILTVKDKENKKDYVITGTTIVDENSLLIKDNSTLTDYKFNYKIKGKSVKLIFDEKTVKLKRVNNTHQK